MLLGLSWTVPFMDALGIQKVQLDKDPLKDKIKQSMLCRRRRNLQEAVNVCATIHYRAN